MTTARRRIRKGPALRPQSKTSGLSLAETWKGSQAGRISARSFLPRLHCARLICPLRAREHAGKNRRNTLRGTRARAPLYAVYVTFARCKCVVPHAISWSNGPRSRGSHSHSHNHARVLPALVPISTEKNRTIIEAANRFRARDSGERAKY